MTFASEHPSTSFDNSWNDTSSVSESVECNGLFWTLPFSVQPDRVTAENSTAKETMRKFKQVYEESLAVYAVFKEYHAASNRGTDTDAHLERPKGQTQSEAKASFHMAGRFLRNDFCVYFPTISCRQDANNDPIFDSRRL